MKRVKKRGRALAALAWALCLALSACGTETPSAISVYDLQKNMLAADDSLPEMLTVNSGAEDGEALFPYLSDLDYGKVDGYFLAYSAEGKADEIAVIVVKDAEDAGEAEASLKRHVQERVTLYQNYEPSQAKRARDAVVFSRGRCAVLIISDRPEAARNAFDETIGVG